MPASSKVWSFFRNLLRRKRIEAELNDELRAYVDELTERHILSGLDPDAARRRALLDVGGVEQVKEEVRAQRVGFALDSWLQDLRYAVRSFRRTPGVAIVVVLTLGVGLGATTAMFGVIDAKVLRKLPVKNPDELVFFGWTSKTWAPARASNVTSTTQSLAGPTVATRSTSFSFEFVERVRKSTSTLSAIVVFDRPGESVATIDGQADRIIDQRVSGNVFEVLGVPARLGRTLSNDDDRPGAAPVAVLSHRFWQRRFGQDPGVLGKSVVVTDTAFTIIGVTPPGFRGLMAYTDSIPDLFIAIQPSLASAGRLEAEGWSHLVLARMKPTTAAEQVRGNLEGLFAGLVAETPVSARTTQRDLPRLEVFSASRGHDLLGLDLDVRSIGLTTAFLMTPAVVLLLVITCLNIANLLLARASARRHEMSIRVALGASRKRLIRQILTESVAISLAAGVIGIVASYWSRGVLTVFLGPDQDLRIDSHTLVFVTVVSIVTGIFVGLAPALQGSRVNIFATAKQRAELSGDQRSRVNTSLLVAQITLSVVLLAGAGILFRSVVKLSAADPGFRTNNLLLFRVQADARTHPLAQRNALYDRITERIDALPDVLGSTRSLAPLANPGGGMALLSLSVANAPRLSGRVVSVHANFFEVMGIPLVRGRSLTSRDDRTAPLVGVVNETLARRLFEDTDPIGQQVRRFNPPFSEESSGQNVEIVGIAKDVNVTKLLDRIQPVIFVSDLQSGLSHTFAVRAAGDPMALVPTIRQAVREVSADVAMIDVKTQTQQIEEGFATTYVLSIAASLFGGAALLLTCIGLFGLMSYSVARRTNEIGVRMALGARQSDVVRLVVGRTLRLVSIGIACGVLASHLANRGIESLIYNVGPSDPLNIAVVSAVVLMVALLAGALPALRACRLNPTVALRNER